MSAATSRVLSFHSLEEPETIPLALVRIGARKSNPSSVSFADGAFSQPLDHRAFPAFMLDQLGANTA